MFNILLEYKVDIVGHKKRGWRAKVKLEKIFGLAMLLSHVGCLSS